MAIQMVLVVSFMLSNVRADEKQGEPIWQTLFNGKDLKNWDIIIRGQKPSMGEDPDKIFQIHDGIIHVYKSAEDGTEVPFGFFITKKEYSHYHLRFEFKWGEKKFIPRYNMRRDAGVLYHVVGKKKVWPRSLELQIEEKGVGDFLTVHGAQAASTVDPKSINIQKEGSARFLEPSEGGQPFVLGGPGVYWLYRHPAREKEGWNTLELIVHGSDSAVHKVNGQVVNRASDFHQLGEDGKTWIQLKKGKILFQAEGAEIFYRNIELKELAVPKKITDASRLK